jgi:hypothetical protein
MNLPTPTRSWGRCLMLGCCLLPASWLPSVAFAADALAPALPADGQAVVERADAALAAVARSTEAQIAKITGQEVKELQRVLDAATKKGSKDQAQAIQARIEAVKAGTPAIAAKGGPGAVLAGHGQHWEEISATLLAELQGKGITPPYPGKTGGVSVDPATGEVYLVICNNGMWKSADHGATFARCDGMQIGGRCETGGAMQWDPAGGRLACFMLDGTAGMTVDGGRTWKSWGGVGRGWDFGAVDWSAKEAVEVIALHHESGGEIYRSNSAGASWTMVAKDNGYGAVGLFDATTLIAAKGNDGIQRSVDNGKTWNKVAAYAVTSHVMMVYGGAGYLIAKEGLVMSKDQGASWTSCGAPVDATFGPLFADRSHLVVWNGKAILESTDAGATWTAVCPMPDGFKPRPDLGWNPPWYINVGWDRAAGILYCSYMGSPAYRWKE